MDAFVFVGVYLAPLEQVDAMRPLHRAWLATLQDAGQLVLAGRRLSGTGAVIVVLAESHETARLMAAADPYVAGGLARYEVIGFEAARWGSEPPRQA
jgi:uncharacterized protein YciI